MKKKDHTVKINVKLVIVLFLFPLQLPAAPGFFLDDWTPRVSPLFDSAVVEENSPGVATSSFSINITDTVAPILPTIWGNNANFYLFNFVRNAAALDHLRATGVKNLRLPGGNISNKWLWDGKNHWSFWENYADDITSKPTQQWNLSAQDQASIADSVGAMPQPCVNLALARYIVGPDSVQQAASYAAAWVRQWNVVENRGVKYWEVGNENYGSWQKGYVVNGDTITGQMYGEMFNVFADSMRAADPTIKIGAVVFEGESNPWTGQWNQDMLPVIQNHADFLAVHQYFTWAPDMNDVTVEQMIGALPKIQETVDMLRHQVDSLTNKSPDELPVAMTEYNVRAGRKNSQQVSAVFNAMALGEYVRHGYGLVNIWDVANGFNGGNDHGMFTRNDPDRNNYDPNPTFYAYYLTQRYFGDQLLGVTPESDGSIRVYPTLFSDGNLGVMVVNSGADSQRVELDLGNFNGNGEMLSHHLTAESPKEREVFLNGVSGGSVSGPLNYTEILPILREFSGDPIVETAPYSVNCYLFKRDDSTGFLEKTKSKAKLAKPLFVLTERGIKIGNILNVPAQFQIVQLNGRVVYSQAIPAGFSGVIPFPPLALSAYLIRISGESISTVEKLIVK